MKKDTIAYEDFAKLDIRVGEIVAAEPIEGSEKLLALHVNLGEDYDEAEILTGIKTWYDPQELIGKKLLFLANLEPRPMMGRTSQGMMLAVDGEDKAILLTVDQALASGSSVR